ncbi:hypothetical protein B0H10DRAFT_749524 [Mycena sp. CBHHK59/15]|nr:hypothetical protein B0H10DRAFT_749524 [Mycena sp. CBHHK59/15]
MENYTYNPLYTPNPDTRWSDLPVDIWISILCFLDPQDIFALRKVCKCISGVTSQRTVWIHALRRVCAQRDFFLPSFPLTDMSLDDLEHASTARGRFASRLRREFSLDRVVTPFSTRRLTSLDHPEEKFDHLRFVPGGRFLLTTSGCTLRLWDLGIHLDPLVNAAPIACVEIEGGGDIQTVRTRDRKSNLKFS